MKKIFFVKQFSRFEGKKIPLRPRRGKFFHLGSWRSSRRPLWGSCPHRGLRGCIPHTERSECILKIHSPPSGKLSAHQPSRLLPRRSCPHRGLRWVRLKHVMLSLSKHILIIMWTPIRRATSPAARAALRRQKNVRAGQGDVIGNSPHPHIPLPRRGRVLGSTFGGANQSLPPAGGRWHGASRDG